MRCRAVRFICCANCRVGYRAPLVEYQTSVIKFRMRHGYRHFPVERDEIRSAIAGDSHLPLARIFTATNTDALAEYHCAEWQKADPFVFQRKESDRIAALALLAELEWDTRVLGLSAGRILYANAVGDAIDPRRIAALKSVLNDVTAFAREKQMRLLDARVSNEDLFVMRAFESEGFHMVDLLVTLGAAREKFDRILQSNKFERNDDRFEFGNGLMVRPMRQEDEATLAHRISYSDHTMIQDRFFLEPAYSQLRAQEVFREWFLNIAKRHHDGKATVLTAEFGGVAAGYIALEPMAALAMSNGGRIR